MQLSAFGSPAKLIMLFGGLLAATLAVWSCALIVFAGQPALLGTAALAFTLGLRHAVDADHISAIDNVTRKLVYEGKRPLTVGWWFSLGHSTVVVALTVAIALAAAATQAHLPLLEAAGGVIGTAVSSGFLIVIAALNAAVFCNLLRRLRGARRAEAQLLGEGAPAGGLLAHLLRPCTRAIGASWHMYPLGVLFGLGFDTATEVGVLGIAALEARHGLPVVAILLFPALFTVGMSLLDTADGVLMLGAYRWASISPLRRLSYNLGVTGISVLVAVAVAAIELGGLLGADGRLGAVGARLASLGDHFGIIGFGIVATFALVWAASVLAERRRYPLELGVAGEGSAMPSASNHCST